MQANTYDNSDASTYDTDSVYTKDNASYQKEKIIIMLVG